MIVPVRLFKSDSFFNPSYYHLLSLFACQVNSIETSEFCFRRKGETVQFLLDVTYILWLQIHQVLVCRAEFATLFLIHEQIEKFLRILLRVVSESMCYIFLQMLRIFVEIIFIYTLQQGFRCMVYLYE